MDAAQGDDPSSRDGTQLPQLCCIAAHCKGSTSHVLLLHLHLARVLVPHLGLELHLALRHLGQHKGEKQHLIAPLSFFPLLAIFFFHVTSWEMGRTLPVCGLRKAVAPAVSHCGDGMDGPPRSSSISSNKDKRNIYIFEMKM